MNHEQGRRALPSAILKFTPASQPGTEQRGGKKWGEIHRNVLAGVA